MLARLLLVVPFALSLAFFSCDDGDGPADTDPDADSDVGDADAEADPDGDAPDGDTDHPDTDPEEPEWPEGSLGQLRAGTADATLDLPVGIPLAAYTARCSMFGGEPEDDRDAPYSASFVPSTGVQTRPPLHVVWLEAGDETAVLVKIDIGYAFDGLTRQIEEDITALTGVDVEDRVFVMTSHSHSSYGTYSQAHFLFLGHDRFVPETLMRISAQASLLALQAYNDLEPAAIGLGVDPEFDPDNQIFRSRRDAHIGLVDDFGVEVEHGYKDPNLYVLRIDASQGTEQPDDDTPMAILFGFGIHGTIMGDGNSLVSSESSGAIELKLENHFDFPMTLMHFQVNGGDLSPAGVQDDFAKMESIGELAAPRIIELWQNIETTTEDIRLESLVRTIPLGRDIRVTRDGEVDLHYLPYDEDYEPDMEVFDENNEPLNPFDEFIAPYGAALCGDSGLSIPLVGMDIDVPPYSSCALVDQVAELIFPAVFRIEELGYELEFPLWETRSTMLGAVGFESLPITIVGEKPMTDQVVLGFIPGEPNTLLGRSFQFRADNPHGLGYAIPVGYSMDHEGYVLTVDDWMSGGYEPSINVWGPLQGEYTLDELLRLSDLINTTVREDPSWPYYEDQSYPEVPFEPNVPESYSGCGSVASAIPKELWTRDGWSPPTIQPPSVVRRVSDIAHFVFLGGDPVIDQPTVTLQREQTPGEGDFADVLLPNGLPLTDRGYDMILSYTPDPLAREGEDSREHYWLIEWQAVTDRPSLDHMSSMEAGMYRFAVSGVCADPADTEYPFEGTDYEIFSEPFELTGENALRLTLGASDGSTLSFTVSYPEAERGYRLLYMAGEFRNPTPIVGGGAEPSVTVDLLASDGLGDPIRTWTDVSVTTSDNQVSAGSIDISAVAAGDYRLRVTDIFGNSVTSALTI